MNNQQFKLLIKTIAWGFSCVVWAVWRCSPDRGITYESLEHPDLGNTQIDKANANEEIDV